MARYVQDFPLFLVSNVVDLNQFCKNGYMAFISHRHTPQLYNRLSGLAPRPDIRQNPTHTYVFGYCRGDLISYMVTWLVSHAYSLALSTDIRHSTKAGYPAKPYTYICILILPRRFNELHGYMVATPGILPQLYQ